MNTYRTMDESDLGDNATPEDLLDFCLACERRQDMEGGTDEEVTEWMWNGGEWDKMVRIYVRPEESLPF